MTTEDMIRELENVVDKYEGKPVPTFGIDIAMMCRDVISKLKELSNPWHTGTPTEEGDYLLIIKAPKGVPHYFPNHLNSEGKWRYVYRGNIIAYQIIKPCGDIVNLA